MNKKTKIIIGAAAVVVIIAGIVAVTTLQHKEALTEAKDGAMEAMSEVRLEDYEESEQGQVEGLIKDYTVQVEKAESAEQVEKLMEQFWDEVNSIQTKEQKLDESKNEAKEEISSFSTKDYDADGVKKIEELQEKYMKAVDDAESENAVKKAVKNFKSAIEDVKTKAEIQAEQEALEEAEAAEAQKAAAPAKQATKADAQKYVGSDVSALIAACGAPNSRSYAQSCLGPGQDGVLRYNGFTVYTYKEGGKETVQSVE